MWRGKDRRGKGVSLNKPIEDVCREEINACFFKLEGRLIREKLCGAKS